MKRKQLIKELINEGCQLKRHGKKHDIYFNPKANKKAPIPRHNELSNSLCNLIRKQLGIN